MSLKLALLSLIALSPYSAVSQTRTPPPHTSKVAASRHIAGKSPLEQRLLPYVKAHLAAGAKLTPVKAQAARATSNASGTPLPNFGGYVTAPYYPAILQPSCVATPFQCGTSVELTADFNKDGKSDIAVVQSQGVLNLLINNGTGTFSAPVSYANPNFSSSFVGVAFTADLNKDGYADVVELDSSNNALIVFLNQKDGTFGAAQTFALDQNYGYASAIAIGDVNGDGSVDVVAISANQTAQLATSVTVETYLGSGTGTFAAPTSTGTQTINIPAQVQIPSILGITLGDLNKDGKLDIAADFEESTSQLTGNVVATVALGNGDGSFAPLNVSTPVSVAVVPPVGFPFLLINSVGVQITDLNGDGNPDLAIDSSGILYVALGNGSGSFTSTAQSNIGISAQIAYADVTGDGIPDAVLDDGTLNIWTGKGDGTFTIPVNGSSYVIDPGGAASIAVADFTGDGNADIAHLGDDYKEVSLFAGNGKGSFYGAPMLSSTTDGVNDPFSLTLEAASDIAGNGLTDPIFIDEASANPYVVSALSDGKGGFTYATALAAAAVPNLAFVQPIQADFNGDGKQDLLIAGSDASLSVALSNGDGTFANPVSLALPTTLNCILSYAATGDLNGDGHPDVVVTYPGDAACGGSGATASGYFTSLNNGDGTFAAPVFTASGNELYSAAIADMNGDGIQDLILNDEPFDGSGNFAINLLTGNGDGTFSTGTSVSTNFLISDVVAGDYNQDGKTDLILFTEGESTDSNSLDTAGIILLPGNGDGTFNATTQIGTGNFFLNGVLIDVNHDGIPDIVTALDRTIGQANTYFGMATLLGTGNGTFAQPINSLESLASEYTVAGNFLNDNSTGVVVQTGYGPALFLGQGGSSLALAASAPSIVFGTAETLTATLTASVAGRPTPTGSVSFYDGTTLLGTGTLSGTTATLTVPALAVGSHSITAAYTGDTNFNPATSSASTITVTALAPAFTLTPTPASLTISVGQQGVATLALAANATFSGSVALTCSGLPTNATCTVNPASVTLGGGATSQVSVLIGTTSATATAANDVPRRVPFAGYAGGISLAALLFCFGRRRRLPRAIPSMLAVLLLAFTAAGLSGCSGGSSSNSGNGISTAAKGTYTVTITATPSGSTAAAQTATVAVTLQ